MQSPSMTRPATEMCENNVAPQPVVLGAITASTSPRPDPDGAGPDEAPQTTYWH